jgi:hypothetical protein
VLPNEPGDEELCRSTIDWHLLGCNIVDPAIDDAAVMAVLRVLVMKDIPHPARNHWREMTRQRLQTMHAQVVEEWARVQAYLAQRWANLDVHCPLITPLRALIRGYDEPTTSEELWATGLGDEPTPLPGAPARKVIMPFLTRSGRSCCLLQ